MLAGRYMKLMYKEFAGNLLLTGDRLRPDRALRLALLGPPGSGKMELSKSIEIYLRDQPGRSGDHAHVRVDAGQCSGFEFDEAHARILAAIRASLAGKIVPDTPSDTRDATINFVPNVRALLSEWSGHLFLYLDRLEMLSGNLIRSLGNSFRELIESEGAEEAPDRFHLVWSGAISIFDLRSVEASALAMCEVVTFPLVEQSVRERAVAVACGNAGFETITSEALEAVIAATGAEPGFLLPLLRELQQTIGGGTLSGENVRRAQDTLLKHGWRIPELQRLGKLLLTDEQLLDLGHRLVAGESVYRTEPIADIDKFQLFGMVVLRAE